MDLLQLFQTVTEDVYMGSGTTAQCEPSFNCALLILLLTRLLTLGKKVMKKAVIFF